MDTILRDNDYHVVQDPCAGDLIIYRDAHDRVMHSGLVKLVSDDLVLIESKWGHRGCYLHEPHHSIYATRFTYYRTSRLNGHLLQFKSPLAGAVAKS